MPKLDIERVVSLQDRPVFQNNIVEPIAIDQQPVGFSCGSSDFVQASSAFKINPNNAVESNLNQAVLIQNNITSNIQSSQTSFENESLSKITKTVDTVVVTPHQQPDINNPSSKNMKPCVTSSSNAGSGHLKSQNYLHG